MTDIMAYDEAHYFDIGTSETPDIQLGGVITQLDENSNPKESTKQYIGDDSETTKIVGFANEFPITSDLVKGDEVCEHLYEIFTERKKGNDALVTHYIVELWNEVTTGVYKARKITQSAVITGKTGNPGEQMTFTGSFKGGKFTYGTFNILTNTFTALSESTGLTTPFFVISNSAVVVPTKAGNIYKYIATVLTAVASVTITPTATAGVIKVNDIIVATGVASNAITLGSAGSITRATITVQETNKTIKTYDIDIVRA